MNKEGALLSMAIFINASATTLLFTWVNDYAFEFKHFAQGAAMQMLTSFQTGAVLSALCFAWMMTRVHSTRLMIFNPLLCIAVLTVGILTQSQLVFGICIFICGLLMGVVFSLMISMGGTLFPHKSGTITGILGMANMMGNALITLLSGQALRFISIGTMMPISCGLLVLLLVLTYWFRQRYRGLMPKAAPNTGHLVVK